LHAFYTSKLYLVYYDFLGLGKRERDRERKRRKERREKLTIFTNT